MIDYKEKLIELLDNLSANKIKYLYHLVTKLFFGQTVD